MGRHDEAYAAALSGIAVAERQGVSRTLGSALQANAARALYRLGRWADASRLVEEALAARPVGAGRVSLFTLRGLLAVGRGQDAEAEAALAEAEALIDEQAPIDVKRWLAVATAEHAIWRGDPAAALARLATLEGETDAASATTPSARPTVLDASVPHQLVLGARAVAVITLAERAVGIEDGLAPLADSRLRTSIRRAERRRSFVQVWGSDLAVAKAELDRAADIDVATRVRRWRTVTARLSERPYLRAYALWRLAEAQLAERGARDAAAETLKEAWAASSSLGAKRLADELNGLARRARLSLEGTAAGPGIVEGKGDRPFGLTEREIEVLALLAEGLSNQGIADRLFISPKTASVHVSNIYGKLGVESRVAAATTAHQLGLVPPAADD